jgi:hypothetical protein
MSGEVVDYKFCSMDFGRYCQIHEEDQPQNSIEARTHGAISLGPSGNSQGGQKIYTLTTGKVVVCPNSVITRIHLLAKGMPALSVFTDCMGCIIGDVINKEIYNNNGVPALVDDSILPGVHTDETEGVDEIHPVQEQDPTPAETEDIDLDFTSVNDGNAQPPLVDTPPLVDDAPGVIQVPADDEVCRSQQVCTQAKPLYTPAMTGKKYSFATTILGAGMLGGKAYEYNQVVSYSFMQQLSLKAALREWGDEARVQDEKETLQLHWRETFTPKQISELTNDQQSKVLQSHMFVVRKRTGETKARMVAGENLQQGHVTKDESSSPTVFTKSVLLTSIIDALEEQDIAIINIPNAFI